MSEQNRYLLVRNLLLRNYTGEQEWRGWGKSWWETADTWQDAIQNGRDRAWTGEDYTVVAETPLEDGRSGIIEIQFGPPNFTLLGMKIKALLIEDWML